MEIKSVCVVGGGRMGRQIALNAAIYGFEAYVYDLSEKVCADIQAWADDYMAGRVKKGRMTQEQADKVMRLFHVETDLKKACENADCAIEAVVEREDVKRTVLGQLSDLMREDAIIATNSSVMPSSKFADCVKNPARLCNMHYYNPALVLKIVEVVQGPHTSEETAKACVDFCLATGKKPAWMRKEIGGFLGNYIYGGITMTAKQLVNDGVCSPYDADNAMEYGFGAKMGVFRTNDLTGIDLSLDMMRNQTARTGVKSLMLDHYEKMVAEGRLGKACGHGWYDYDKDPRGTIPPEYMPTADPDAQVAYKEIQTVAVVGAGAMGRQIAMQAAICGYPVALQDAFPEGLEKAKAWADEYLAGRIAKGRMTEEQVAGIKSRLRFENDLAAAVKGADLVIEAIFEDLDLKKELFRQICAIVPEDVILATNASIHPSSKLADAVTNPSRLCNMHFYNPALVMKFVEIVQGPHTAPATARAAYEFCLKLDKIPAWLKKEVPGFLGNHIWGAFLKRCFYLVEEGYCTPQDVDCALEHGFGYKMGPFRIMDLAGIDTRFRRLKLEYERTGEKGGMYDVFEEMVAKGHYGVKSGKGFYDYN